MTVGTVTAADGLREYAGDYARDLVAMLERTVADRGAAVAFVDDVRRVTWSEFGDEVEGLARRLAATGVRQGDRVALLFRNGIPYTVALWAVWRLAAIVVPLNARLVPEEMSTLLRNADPVLLLIGRGLENAGDEVARSLPGLRGAYREDAEGRLLGEVEPAGEPPVTRLTPQDPAAIMYTSGTTGQPKGVIISHRNAVQNSRTCLDVIGRRPGEVELVMVPQFNITGLNSQTIPVVSAGMTGILASAFDPSRILELMEMHAVNATVGSPTMWWRLMEEPSLSERNLSSLRLLLYGGAPMPPALLDRLQRAFPAATFGNGYGMTETCSMLTYIDGADIFAHPNSVGRPLPITDARVVDPQTKRDVGTGEVGELWVKGAQVSAGYWRHPEATGALFEDGWLRTGDAVSIESDGFITLRDRLKDVVKRGGESIYSFEIENVLFQFPAVLDAAVVGIPDEVYGERVKAVVVLKPGQHATESDIKEFCRQHLGRFKVPSIVEFRAELPRNPGGKVLKKLLKEAQPAEKG